MVDYAWFPFLIYFLSIVCPLSIYCCFAIPKLRDRNHSLGQAVVNGVSCRLHDELSCLVVLLSLDYNQRAGIVLSWNRNPSFGYCGGFDLLYQSKHIDI